VDSNFASCHRLRTSEHHNIADAQGCYGATDLCDNRTDTRRTQLPLITKDSVLGCLLGGGLGDAWGGSYEGVTRPAVFEIPLKAALSDDTQQTLATCESIVEFGHVDPANLASHFIRWFLAGRIRGMGSSTLKALQDLSMGTHWALSGRRGEFAAGNGGAMRIAPLAFLLEPSNAENRTLIRDICRITHHSDEAYVGALAVILAIRSVLSGTWSQERSFLAVTLDVLPDSAVRDRIRELLPLKLSASEVAHRFGSTGHVVDTVPLALYCAQFIASEPLPSVLARTISAGGDTDTIGPSRDSSPAPS
jgi:ADP-ribosyl-[dinitrogen reductase] hydrolase